MWKVHRERPVYANPWLAVHLADVELPDGRHLDHYLLRQRPVALTAIVNASDELLLLWRHRFIPDTWGFELPAGVTDPGECAAAATAHRRKPTRRTGSAGSPSPTFPG